MDAILQEIQVSFRYPVHFTTGLFAPANTLLRDLVARAGASGPSRMLVVLDSGVERAHPHLVSAISAYFDAHQPSLELTGPVLVIPGGEQAKNDPAHLQRVLQAIHGAALCRHSYLVAVGGGAVLDVAGFAAATAHRGVRLIRVPTTVLAQDDSAVGVKNGINAFGQKNYVGTFAPPFAVVNDFAFLTTLADRDWRGGLTEAVKAALIRDAPFFDFLEAQAPALVSRDSIAMEQVIRRSAALHLQHIATCGDPFELGSSRPLDFGHWAAHKLEQLTDHRMRHGEAVGIGIALDSTYSYLAGYLPEAQWRRIIGLIGALGLPLYAPALGENPERPGEPRPVLRGLAEFQEHLGGRLTIMMLEDIGRPFDVHEIETDRMLQSIETLKALEAARGVTTAQKAS
ncbi:MAG: 3-dehydroquinate synthase [Acidobacteriota bacterium]|jgi:3-dehydroquinate synthase